MTVSILNSQVQGRGTVTTVRNDERSATAMLSDMIPEESKQYTTAMEQGFIRIGADAERINRDMTALGREQYFRNNLQFLQIPFQASVAVGIKATQAHAKRLDDLDALPEPNPTDPIILQVFTGFSLSEKLAFVESATESQLAAIIGAGRELTFPDVDPQIFDGIVLRHRRLALTAKLGSQARFAGTPSPDDVFAAAKPDFDKAEEFASAFLKGIDKDAEAVDNLRTFLGNTCVLVAVLASVQVTQAHAFLIGEGTLE